MAIPTTRIWTYDDYMQMPDDGKRYEILDGELIELTSPNRRHQQILSRFDRTLGIYVETHSLGEVYVAPFDVKLSPINVLQPDVLFISTPNLGILDNELNVQGAPDLCVEILSPSTQSRDLTRKRDAYARFGVREYWLVDPETQSVAVLVAQNGAFTLLGTATGETTIASTVVSGFAVDARDIFR